MIDDVKMAADKAWPITGDRKTILDFIRKFKTKYGKAPSYRQIASAIGSTSSATGLYYVKQLIEEGWVLPLENNKFTPNNIILNGEVYLPPNEVSEIITRIESVESGRSDPGIFLDYLKSLLIKRRFTQKDIQNGKSP